MKVGNLYDKLGSCISGKEVSVIANTSQLGENSEFISTVAIDCNTGNVILIPECLIDNENVKKKFDSGDWMTATEWRRRNIKKEDSINI